MLKQINEPRSEFYDKLIIRLEASIQDIHTPEQNSSGPDYHNTTSTSNVDYSWQIFDQGSLQQFNTWV